MQFLNESKAAEVIPQLLADAGGAKIAVAFWGAGAIERLKLNLVNGPLSILCNLDSGACNPAELRLVRKMAGVKLRSHASLHAKVYWTSKGAVLGSSNASANGLALEGDAANGWREANLLVHDRRLLDELEKWFGQLFSDGYDITDEHLERAEQLWKARAPMAPLGISRTSSLLEACRDSLDHPVWQRVKVACWSDDLSDYEKALLEAEASKSDWQGVEISAYSEWHDQIQANDWILDIDLSKPTPRFNGIWRALPDDFGTQLRPVYRVKDKHLTFEGVGRFHLTEQDVSDLKAAAPVVLAGQRNGLVSLPKALAMPSPPTATAKPDAKAFGKAMENIYHEAIKIGYRPIAFREMLAKLGGVQTAQQLVGGGAATSGFTNLWEKGRLDLSVEALILDPQWQGLFSPQLLDQARRRLRDLNYKVET